MASQDISDAVQDLEITIPMSTPSTTILNSAISSSLTILGYDPHLIQRVALLATKNTYTVECTLPSAPSKPKHGSDDASILSETTTHALSALFTDLASKNTRINTNEPILLINSLGSLSSSVLHSITDAAASSLREIQHIRPIRIYAGSFTIPSNTTNADFSISVLNVVNTDIGGPNMVQLLDMCDWDGKGCIRREVYDGSGWNLLEREDKGDEKFEEVTPEDLSESGVSEKGEWESEPEPEEIEGEGEAEQKYAPESTEEEAVEVDETPIGTIPTAPGQSLPSSLSAHEEPALSTPEEVEPEAEDPWSQRPQLRDIKHPSWEHEHDKESLLDMISRQSGRLPVSKTGNSYATAAALKEKEKADLSEEDEYEVV